MDGKESHANAGASVICRFAHGHVSVCLCVYVDVVCHFEAAIGKMSLRSALDQIKPTTLWDYVCVNTKTMLV